MCEFTGTKKKKNNCIYGIVRFCSPSFKCLAVGSQGGLAQALTLLQSKHSASRWFELPMRTSSGVEGFCDVEANATSWDCGKISAATDCASKTGCSWSVGDPFPGLCGVRDDPAQELNCKKLTQPTDCVSASCQWYRFAMGPGPVRWSR